MSNERACCRRFVTPKAYVTSVTELEIQPTIHVTENECMGYDGSKYALGETLVRIVKYKFPHGNVTSLYNTYAVPSCLRILDNYGHQCLFFAKTGHQGCISDVSIRRVLMYESCRLVEDVCVSTWRLGST